MGDLEVPAVNLQGCKTCWEGDTQQKKRPTTDKPKKPEPSCILLSNQPEVMILWLPRRRSVFSPYITDSCVARKKRSESAQVVLAGVMIFDVILYDEVGGMVHDCIFLLHVNLGKAISRLYYRYHQYLLHHGNSNQHVQSIQVGEFLNDWQAYKCKTGSTGNVCKSCPAPGKREASDCCKRQWAVGWYGVRCYLDF